MVNFQISKFISSAFISRDINEIENGSVLVECIIVKEFNKIESIFITHYYSCSDNLREAIKKLLSIFTDSILFFIKLIFKIFRCFTPLSEPNYCGIINWSQVVNVLVWNLRDGNNLLFSKDFLFFVSIIQSFKLNCYFAFLNINNLKSKKRKSKYLFHG